MEMIRKFIETGTYSIILLLLMLIRKYNFLKIYIEMMRSYIPTFKTIVRNAKFSLSPKEQPMVLGGNT